jgi:hypothetical protein
MLKIFAIAMLVASLCGLSTGRVSNSLVISNPATSSQPVMPTPEDASNITVVSKNQVFLLNSCTSTCVDI